MRDRRPLLWIIIADLFLVFLLIYFIIFLGRNIYEILQIIRQYRKHTGELMERLQKVLK
ncbi:hypothetical protein [Clostridium perfringens]|uniref:Uncharacterized protein n=1 Tax=Clostridium perfringens TaxID=1502 RepID=A0AAP6WM49_CLOPF|nr:hypothetical protein [Clostridium perfringens]NGU29521.1 hypothetical protein [Clostridium perfringens]WEV04513.1 hypothetical protein PL322_10870 [Clostridium perfringens B]WEV23410.1 hypothetical protein PL327_06875 [Clostridium perfringens D]